jgi:hypothetical protein
MRVYQKFIRNVTAKSQASVSGIVSDGNRDRLEACNKTKMQTKSRLLAYNILSQYHLTRVSRRESGNVYPLSD